MTIDDLRERVTQLRSDLHTLAERIKELTDAFDAYDHTTDTPSPAEVIDSLSDARLDLNTADRHLETAMRHADRLSTG
ncbi:hypothetical protein [Rhodococcus sp. NPDC057529]|uniref:hypothetical protein n=1 Tax=Rhodococcus sp. NPDC057529 TaxID=3346158 RepID=UPI0036702521